MHWISVKFQQFRVRGSAALFLFSPCFRFFCAIEYLIIWLFCHKPIDSILLDILRYFSIFRYLVFGVEYKLKYFPNWQQIFLLSPVMLCESETRNEAHRLYKNNIWESLTIHIKSIEQQQQQQPRKKSEPNSDWQSSFLAHF